MELIGKNITYKYPSSKKYVLKDVLDKVKDL
mgnify:CR=1 FL=1